MLECRALSLHAGTIWGPLQRLLYRLVYNKEVGRAKRQGQARPPGSDESTVARLLHSRVVRKARELEVSRLDRGEGDFVKHLQRREERAWQELYNSMYVPLYRYGLASLGNPQEAEDVASETFLRALENIDHFEPRGVPIQNWLWRIAHNLVVNRSSRSQTAGSDVDISSWLKDRNSPTIEHTLQRRWRAEALAKGLGQIRHLYREVIYLRFYEGLPAKEVGSILGKSAGAVRVLQHRALAALQQVLEHQGKGRDDLC